MVEVVVAESCEVSVVVLGFYYKLVAEVLLGVGKFISRIILLNCVADALGGDHTSSHVLLYRFSQWML